jgi:hypothetical protein
MFLFFSQPLKGSKDIEMKIYCKEAIHKVIKEIETKHPDTVIREVISSCRTLLKSEQEELSHPGTRSMARE